MAENVRFTLPEAVRQIIQRLNDHGYEAYVVGGCVRDMLRNVAPHDYDMCTSAMPEETKACFKDHRVIETGIQHGTVTVMVAHEPFEITTYRTEGDYLDGRHPSSVAFTRDLENDLQRRDFTINAMAYHPERGLVDLYGGQKDIENRCLRCVGDAHTRLTEDALRILRAMRFAAELGFTVEEQTAQAMTDLKNRLSLISRERIASELIRMIGGAHAACIIRQFRDIFCAALPQCRQMDLPALERAPLGDTVLRTAALLHPLGAKEAESALHSLKLSTLFTRDCTELIAHYDAVISSADVPLWLARLGERQFARLAQLKEAAVRDELLLEMQRAIDESLPLRLRDLAVNGQDLIAAGIPAGRQVGETLSALHEKVLKREIANDQQTLLAALGTLK